MDKSTEDEDERNLREALASLDGGEKEIDSSIGNKQLLALVGSLVKEVKSLTEWKGEAEKKLGKTEKIATELNKDKLSDYLSSNVKDYNKYAPKFDKWLEGSPEFLKTLQDAMAEGATAPRLARISTDIINLMKAEEAELESAVKAQKEKEKAVEEEAKKAVSSASSESEATVPNEEILKVFGVEASSVSEEARSLIL